MVLAVITKKLAQVCFWTSTDFSYSSKCRVCWEGFGSSLIQTTLHSPFHRDPHPSTPTPSITKHSSGLTPWPLHPRPPPANQNQADSVSLSVTSVHTHKSLLSLQDCLHPQSHVPLMKKQKKKKKSAPPCTLMTPPPQTTPSLHPLITTLHIQVTNEFAPVCGIRSKVDLTVFVGFRGK